MNDSQWSLLNKKFRDRFGAAEDKPAEGDKSGLSLNGLAPNIFNDYDTQKSGRSLNSLKKEEM